MIPFECDKKELEELLKYKDGKIVETEKHEAYLESLAGLGLEYAHLGCTEENDKLVRTARLLPEGVKAVKLELRYHNPITRFIDDFLRPIRAVGRKA